MDLPSSSTDYLAQALQKSSTERADMVEAARQFFTNPRVKGTPLEEQKNYLREKGLTEAEIQQAIDAVADESAALSLTDLPGRGGGGGSRIFNALQSAVVVGGASYMAYKLMRTWVLPKFFDIPDPAREQSEALQAQISDLQKSVKLMMDGVAQTLEAVSAQQEQLNRALMLMSNNGVSRGNDLDKLQSDIGIVKSLLLNQNQFPPIPEFPTTKMTNKVNGTANSDAKENGIKASQRCLNGSGSNCSEDGNDDV